MHKASGLRRAVLSVLTALLALTALESTSAPGARAAALQMRFKAIKVDVSPLTAKGLAPEASWMAQDLPGALSAAFAQRLAHGDPAAPTLVLRIDSGFLGASARELGSSRGRVASLASSFAYWLPGQIGL